NAKTNTPATANRKNSAAETSTPTIGARRHSSPTCTPRTERPTTIATVGMAARGATYRRASRLGSASSRSMTSHSVPGDSSRFFTRGTSANIDRYSGSGARFLAPALQSYASPGYQPDYKRHYIPLATRADLVYWNWKLASFVGYCLNHCWSLTHGRCCCAP